MVKEENMPHEQVFPQRFTGTPDKLSSQSTYDSDRCSYFEDTTIDGKYQVERYLRRDNHADVYSARSTTEPQMTDLEARAYVLEGTSHGLRRYRLRNIKRLSKRTVLETREQGLTVVVYKTDTDSNNARDSKGWNDSNPPPPPPKENLNAISRKIKNQKSDHQREMARLRQSERRKSNRQKERQLKAGEISESNSLTDAADRSPETDENETLYILLYLAFNDQPQLRQQLPTSSRLGIENYLQKQDMKFKDDDEMEEFMKTKLCEMLYLKRQQKKLPEIERMRHDQFGKTLREQSRLPRSSKEYGDMQEGVKIAQHRLKVIRHVRDLLPGLISDVESTYLDLKDRLLLARSKKKEVDQLIDLTNRRKRLQEKIDFYQKCSQTVVPGSGPYAQVVSQFHAAEQELKHFDAMEGSLVAPLKHLQEDYQSLLGFLGREEV